jgi:uncharacterized membrane protein YdjX (TVP38/TMEM64 family)
MAEEQVKQSFGIKQASILAVILGIAILGYFQIKDYVSFDALAENREALLAWRDSNYVLSVLTFIGVYILVVAFSLPGASLMTFTGGFLFATFPGSFYNIIGATIGAVLIFLAAKTFLGDFLYSKIHTDDGKESILERMDKELHENTFNYLLILRLVPAIPFFISNLAPAFLGVKLRTFALTTFLGIFPGAIVYTSVGAGLGEVFARGETPNLGIIFEPHILGPIIGLIVLAALPILIKKFKKGATA